MDDASPDVVLRAELAKAAMRVADLNRDLADIAESTTGTPDDEHDPEGSTIGYERARVTALLHRARRDVAELDTALARLATGTYRRCQGCGAEIPAERLVALPATRVCLGCAASSPAR